jgi:hypothetical protein
MLVISSICAADRGLWTGVYNFGNVAGFSPVGDRISDQATGSTPAFVLAAVMIATGQFFFWFVVGELKAQP